jgi:acyl dehydratase
MTRPRDIRLREEEQPGAKFEDFEVGRKLSELRFTIDREVVDQYVKICHGDRDYYLGNNELGEVIAPASTLSVYQLPVLYQGYPPDQGIVLTHQKFQFHAPLRPDRGIVAQGEVIDKYERRGKHYVSWRAIYRDEQDGTVLAETQNTFMLPS